MKEKKIVKVGNIEAGKDELFLISGPCVIEDESIMLKTAEPVSYTHLTLPTIA